MKILPESGIATAAEQDLTIPDPPNALEILQNAAIIGTTGNYPQGDRQNSP